MLPLFPELLLPLPVELLGLLFPLLVETEFPLELLLELLLLELLLLELLLEPLVVPFELLLLLSVELLLSEPVDPLPVELLPILFSDTLALSEDDEELLVVVLELLLVVLLELEISVEDDVLFCGSLTSDTEEELSLGCSTGLFTLHPTNCAITAITTNADNNVFFINSKVLSFHNRFIFEKIIPKPLYHLCSHLSSNTIRKVFISIFRENK